MASDIIIHGLRPGESYPGLDDLISEIKAQYGIKGDFHIFIENDFRDGPNLRAIRKSLYNISIKKLEFKRVDGIIITRGVLSKLDVGEKRAMIAHEFSHVIRKDVNAATNIFLIYVIIAILSIIIIPILAIFYQWKNLTILLLVIASPTILFILGLRNANWRKRRMESRCDFDAILITNNPEALKEGLKKLFVDYDVKRDAVRYRDTWEYALTNIFYYIVGNTHPLNQERIKDIDALKRQ